MERNRLIQINVNHTPSAQDLLHQVMAERGVDIAVVTEPYRVPTDHTRWAADKKSWRRWPLAPTVAITWRHTDTSLPCAFVEAGDGYVAVRWGKWLVVGVYIPPRLNIRQYERRLDSLQGCINRHPWPALVAGDFNAHSTSWGSRVTNGKGRAVEEWAQLGLILLNRGSVSTCVRPQGESIVDLTWAAPPAAARVTKWEVVTGVYSDSDHLYIQVDLECTPVQVLRRRQPQPPRWSLRALDTDILEGALRAGVWPVEETAGDPIAGAERLRALMARACECAMPRVVPCPRRRTYWWSQAIAELRRSANAARRRLKHLRREIRRGSANRAEEEAAANDFTDAKHTLRRAIGIAKAKAWQELLDSVNKDTWGRPYKMVMNKIKQWAPPFTESMDPLLRERILESLFPTKGGGNHPLGRTSPRHRGGVEGRVEGHR